MGTQGQSCTGLPTSASLRPPPRCAQILAFLTPPNPAVLSRAKTTPQASCWPGASSISRILCLSFRNTVPPHPAAPLLPIAVGFVRSCASTHCSLSVSIHALPSRLALFPPHPPSVPLRPSALHTAFLAGQPPPRPPQPAIFAQSKWGCSRCLGPCPRPLSPLIPPLLLEGTEPQWAGWVGGGVGCVL